MAVGGQAQLTTGGVDARINALIQNIDDALEAGAQFNTWIIGSGGGIAGLQLIPAGGGRATIYTAGDATAIFNMFADLNKLRQVAHGLQTVSPVQDFFVNARNGGSTALP